MKNIFYAIIIIVIGVSSCTTRAKTVLSDNTSEPTAVLPPLPENATPIFGYRFAIEGDFDGDGKKEMLTEHLISLIDRKETNKYFEVEDYGDMVGLTIKKRNYSFLLSENTKIDTLRVHREGQIYGISFLKNEGDLNGDGTDEVSYVIDWADFSSMNSWNIVTYRKGSWKELYSFRISDGLLPDLPEATNRYGPFGADGKTIVKDTANERVARELLQWKGLVKRMKKNKIQVTYSTVDAGLDSMVVNLKHPKKVPGF
jgi:hypothetical protein